MKKKNMDFSPCLKSRYAVIVFCFKHTVNQIMHDTKFCGRYQMETIIIILISDLNVSRPSARSRPSPEKLSSPLSPVFSGDDEDLIDALKDIESSHPGMDHILVLVNWRKYVQVLFL